MTLLAFGRTAFVMMLLVGLCACGQQSSPSKKTDETETRSERLGEIQALTESAREAYALLDGVWDAESVYTAPSGAEARLETVLTFERDGDRLTWAETYDEELMDVQLDGYELGLVLLLVQPKTLLLVADFDEGFVYINKLHLVFDEHASFDAGAEHREKLYDLIRGGGSSLFDKLSAEMYQPYVVTSVEPDRIVLQRPARVFPEAVEQALNANEDNPDQVGGRLELILTRRAPQRRAVARRAAGGGGSNRTGQHATYTPRLPGLRGLRRRAPDWAHGARPGRLRRIHSATNSYGRLQTTRRLPRKHFRESFRGRGEAQERAGAV